MDTLTSSKPNPNRKWSALATSVLPRCPRWLVYGSAAVLTSVTLFAAIQIISVNGSAPVLMVFLIPVVLSAYVGGLGPGLCATTTAALLSNYFILTPTRSFHVVAASDQLRWTMLVVIGVLVSLLSEMLHRSRRQSEAERQQHAVTLASIGDAVITTDYEGRITFLNTEAERLTGCAWQEADGRPLNAVFNIINEDTRQSVDDPVQKVLHSRATVGLANHTVLIARDGRETPIDDSTAPIKQPDGTVTGVVLVFRDCAEKKRGEAALKERLKLQEQFAKVAATAPGAICSFRLGPDGSPSFPYASPAIEGIYGVLPEEAARDASVIFDKVHPDDIEHNHKGVAESARTLKPWQSEFRVRHPLKGEIWVESRAMPERESNGGTLWHGFLQDITERKRAEAALRESEAKFRSYVENAPLAVFVADRDGRFEDCNRAAVNLLGYDAAALGQMQVTDIHPEADRQLMLETHAALHTRKQVEGEFRLKRKDDRLLWVSLHAAVIEDGRSIGFLQDITERRQVEEEVRRLSRALEQSPVSVMITDLHGKIEYVNSRFTQVTGYTPEEVLGQNPRILKSGETSASEYSQMWRTITAGGEWHGQFHNRKKNHELYWELASISPIRDAQGNITHFLAIKEDITELKLAQERIRAQAALLDQTEDAILVIGLDRRVIYCNRAAEKLYGRAAEELVGQSADALMFPETPQRCAEVCRTTTEHGAWAGEVRLPGEWNKHRFVYSRSTLVRNAKGRPEAFLAVITDITEKKRLEQQFLRAQRMEGIGTLASGVAHDLNNVLAPILMGIESFQSLASEPEDRAILKMLNESAHRGADIVKQLLAFGRGLEGQRMEMDLVKLLKEMTKVIQQTFPKSIVLDPHYPKDLWLISADPTQIHQVLLNLCVNARDAMPEGGKLTIAAENLELDEDYADINREAKPGPHVVLQVNDTGTGIPPEILEKIFDPFFTTKEPGKGTGLGLSTVLGIVKSHGGFLQVASRVDEGTSFKIYLPALKKNGVLTKPAQPATLPKGSGQLVLVVDDEESIRNVARRILEGNGYRVLVAANGVEALDACRQQQGDVQVVITDMVMPVMDGLALIRALRGERPQLHIIAMSGLATLKTEGEKAELKTSAFLLKPFTADRLLLAVDEVLAKRRTA